MKSSAYSFIIRAAAMRRAIARGLIALLLIQTLIPPTVGLTQPLRSWDRRLGQEATSSPTPSGNSVAVQPLAATPDNFGIVLTQVSTTFQSHLGIEHHQPTGKVLLSANSPTGQPKNFELIGADGVHRGFSNISGWSNEIKIATARDDGQGSSLGGFKPGELFASTGVPGVIARVAADGALVQNPWVTLPQELGLPSSLYVDRTGVFGGHLIVVTTQGGVWRVSTTGTATRLANVGTPLEGVTTIPNEVAQYGPWAGKILAGAKTQSAIYAIDPQGQATTYPLDINPQEIKLIPAHENFYGVDPSSQKLWGAPSAAFTGMIGDVLVAQQSPGILLRLHWNGTEFEASQIAQVAQWKQITFSPAGIAEIPAVPQIYNQIAVVRHAPTMSSGRVEGALWQLLGENITLSGTSTITSDLLVPGTPTVNISEHPTFSGVLAGTGSTQPTGYSLSLSGNASLRYLVTRTDPIQLTPVTTPPAPAGTRDVSLTQAGQSAGDFTTLRNLSLSGKAGAMVVPPGTYGQFTASGQTSFIFGVANSTEPTVYNLQGLSLSGSSQLNVVGPVILTVKQNVMLGGGSVGLASNPRQLTLQVAEGGVSLSGSAVLYAIARVPQGTVDILGNGRLRGTVTCDRLSISGNGVLQVTESDLPPPPINRPPAVNAGPDQTITLPTNAVSLNGVVSDDGLPAGSTLSVAWTKVSGPGPVTFSNANAAATTATFTDPGTYVLRLTASDTLLTSSDDVTVTVVSHNQPPTVDAGPDQTIELPASANLTGTVSDDALPAGSTVTVTWSKVSGPGTVAFSNPNAAVTTASFSTAGSYTLRLTASDTELTASDEVVITVQPENHAPVVNAGPDLIITLPAAANLNGTVSDDGLPVGSTLTIAWSKVSGPGDVTFANPNQATTTATFSAPGTYVLRLSANDTRFTTSDDATVVVNPANQAPVVSAGADQTVTLGVNLIQNPSNEAQLVNGKVPNWVEVAGNAWTQAQAGTNGFPRSLSGSTYFYAGETDAAELRQDVDVSAFAATIAAGTQSFAFKGYFRSRDESPVDTGRIIIEYRDVTNTNVLATVDSGLLSSIASWELFANTSLAPTGTGWIRVRLLSTRQSGTTNDAYFDALSLRAVTNAGVKLNGIASDDGLPVGSALTTTWSKVSGPGTVIFANPNTATTAASIDAAGSYVLRLMVSDGDLASSSDVTITVNPANQAPTVNAGVDQAVTLPNSTNLNGVVTDDGLPTSNTVIVTWVQVSGPGTAIFGNPNLAATTASFSTAGTYVLRLIADDGDQISSDDVTITVSPQNQAPVVNAGVDQMITLPASASLNGTVTDDGLPTGSALTITWSKVSGPGAVTFSNPNAATTTASFSLAGTYVLRLTASDGQLSSSDDVVITVNSGNQAPVVNAGADQTITLPNSASLSGTVSDDGLPVGGTLSVTWSVVSGPGTVTFADAHNPVTLASFDKPGTYVLRLTASDSELSASDDVMIQVQPELVSIPHNKGTNFWLTFPGSQIDNNPLPSPKLFITAETDTTGTVTIPGLGFSASFSVTAGSVTTVALPSSADLGNSQDTITDKGIHVTAQHEVAVYGLNNIKASNDAFLGLPTGMLGTEYLALGYKNADNFRSTRGSQFAIVGTVNGTQVTITPSATIGSHPAGISYSITINQGQTYQLRNPNAPPSDLSGTIITADKPVAVFGSHQSTTIPGDTSFTNYLVEQLPPTSAWGTNFVAMPLATRRNGDTFRFLAAQDDTQISLNGSAITTLNRGQVHERLISGAAYITATKPILVAQYSNSGSFDATNFNFRNGDPFMMLITPTNQFLTSYVVTTQLTDLVASIPNQIAYNYLNITVPNAGVGVVSLDGNLIPASSFTPIAGSGYSGAQVLVTTGAHNLSSSMAFGVWVYGLGQDDGYGYPGGIQLTPSANPAYNQPPAVNAGPDQTAALPVGPGKIFVNHDEQTLSDNGFSQAPDARQFALNIASYFTGGRPGRFLVLSTNFGLNGSQLAATMTGAGHVWQIGGTANLSLATLLQYDAVFLCGDAVDNQTLIDYVRAGGNVYLAGGTSDGSQGGMRGEAARWNTFLNAFNLNFRNNAVPFSFVLNVRSTHPIFTGVRQLFYDTGLALEKLNPGNPDAAILDSSTECANCGLYGIYEGNGLNIPVHLSGLVTDDGVPPGIDVTVAWSKVSGPGKVTFANSRQAITDAYFSTPGTYVLRLMASDALLTGQDEVTITLAGNRPPVVNAGADQTILLASAANLSGTASDDGVPAGSTLSFTWSKVSGPGPVTFSNANAAATTASFSATGTYVLRLTASDSQLSGSDDITITVQTANQAPAVNAGPDQTIALPSATPTGGKIVVCSDEVPFYIGQFDNFGNPVEKFFSNLANYFTGGRPGRFLVYSSNFSYTSGRLYQYIADNTSHTWVISRVEDFTLPNLLKYDAVFLAGDPADNQVLIDYVKAGGNVYLGAGAGPGPATDEAARWNTFLNYFGLSIKGEYNSLNTTLAPESRHPLFNNVSFLRYVFGQYVSKLNPSDLNTDIPENFQGEGLFGIYANPNPPLVLRGTATDDGLPTGNMLQVTWSQVNGTGTVTFSNPNAATTTATFSAPGSYTLRLTASDSVFTSSDDVVITVTAANQPPAPNAGPDRTVEINQSLSLNGAVSDDGLPFGGLNAWWVKVSGPGNVSFSNYRSAATSASFSAVGTYVLRLYANDGTYTRSDDVVVTATPANQAPFVNAGPDQAINAPANIVTLNGTASDDGLPAGSSLSVTWSKVSGPGTVTFSNPNSATTNATFSVPGVYTLRLSATDGALTSSDDAIIRINQAPVVNAGADQTITREANLLQDPGNEAALVSGQIPGWVTVTGNWTQAAAGTSNFPAPFEGNTYFYADSSATAELRQDVDVSAFAAQIAAGTQQFEFKAYLRSLNESPADSARVIVEYRDASNSTVLGALDSGEITNTTGWQQTSDIRAVPAGTRWIRIRLIATRNNGVSNDAYFDGLSLRAVGMAATQLNGVVTDDGLPVGSTLTTSWSQVSGPGTTRFVNQNAAVTAATFDAVGTYVLRLTASDGQLTTSDDVTIIVASANQAPVVNAGPDRTISLPQDTLTLGGTVTDDGLPAGSALTIEWSKVSGPGTVTFGQPDAAITSASFSAAGTYFLRLRASDGEREVSDEVTVTLTSANQAPSVNAGTDQTITLPTNSASLNATVSDDGLPAGNTLQIAWSQVSGPSLVNFSQPNSATTTVSFNHVAGTYVLRVQASDGALIGSDEVTITVVAQNQAPVVNAGPDQTIYLPNAAQLNGAVSDDGLPAGGQLTRTWSVVSGPGSVTFSQPNQAITQASFSAAGVYVLRLTASDSALSSSDDVVVTVNPSPGPPPTVSINSPADGDEITTRTPVIGTVSFPSAGGTWKLEYSLNSTDGVGAQTWIQFAAGSGNVTNSVLSQFDPTLLLNGIYALRLTATDVNGQYTATTISVLVTGNQKVGHFTLSFNDLSVPLPGLPIQVIRTYDSRDKRVGDFGVGWRLTLNNVRVEKTGVLGQGWEETSTGGGFPTYSIQSIKPKKVTVTFPDGRVYKFAAVSNPQTQAIVPIQSGTVSFVQIPGTSGTAGATLEAIGNNTYQVDGAVPGVVNLIDTQTLDIYNPTRFKLTTAEGFQYVIDQREGVLSVRDLNGNTLTINANGMIHSAGQSVAFVRDSFGRITSITDPAGHALVYGYDGNGDLVSFTDRENNTTTFGYENNHYLKTIHDPRGIQPLRNEYDADGRLLSTTDAFNKTLNYVHDLDNRRETITDRLGRTTIHEYDANGNVLKTTDAKLGVTTYTYDARDNQLTITNAIGKTTSYTYDSNDNKLTETDPLNHTTTYTYNNRRQPLTITDARGKTTTNVYDNQGNLTSTTDANGKVTSFTYDQFSGMRLTMTDALNNVTSYAYDRNGYLNRETDALGNVTRLVNDAQGNVLSRSVTRTKVDGTSETSTTSYEYDQQNRLVKTIAPDSSFTRTVYNSIGQVSETYDQLNRKTSYEYDEMGRVTKTTYPDTTFESATYDAEGRRLTSTDRANHTTSYEYDELGRLTKTTYADSSFTTTAYDAIGRVTSVTDARSNTTSYDYDTANRRTKVTDARLKETQFTYDANGNQLTMTDANNHTTSYEYDNLNRRTKTTFHDGTFSTTTYDELGRTIAKTDQASKTTQYEYDKLSRLVKVTDALNQVTRYSYDEVGNQLTQTDANNHTTSYEYDQLGRRVKRKLPGSQVESYSYNVTGTLANRIDFNGKTTNYAYDSLNRLLSKTPEASFGQAPISFTYNSLGQRQTMVDTSGTTTYSYDNRNRLTSKATPQGTLTYTYDGASNLKTVRSSNANGYSVDYSYDSLNRLATVKDNNLTAGSNTTGYSYDDVGNLAGYLYPNSVSTTYTYNSLNRLTSLTINKGVTSLAAYAYTLGNAGNRTAVTELNERQVDYTYDALYRLTSETISQDPHLASNGAISYTYDAVGNRLSRSSNVVAVPSTSTTTFDANDRLNSDVYDANGNTTSSAGSGYQYDFENRLLAVNVGTPQEVRYVYDGDGNRVSKTASGVTVKYLVDSHNLTGYAQVVEEMVSGNVQRVYSYGLMRISQRQLLGGNWTASFFEYDGQGSVRSLTDVSGVVTDTYDYDAFGNLINRTGTTPNDYLYAGEQLDPNLGFYYLRARYLSVESGRFWTLDTYEGCNCNPQSQHKYLYTQADPVNRRDPSGKTSLAEVGTVQFTQRQLAAIAVLSLATVCAIQYQLSASGADGGIIGGPCSKAKTYYRGTGNTAENDVYKQTGHLLSDAARQVYVETGSLSQAYASAAATHAAWVAIFWGSELAYAQAHGAFGSELGEAFGLKRTFVSVTKSLETARYFANFNGPGKVYAAEINGWELVPQTLPGANEGEYLIRLGRPGFREVK